MNILVDKWDIFCEEQIKLIYHITASAKFKLEQVDCDTNWTNLIDIYLTQYKTDYETFHISCR